MAAQSGNIRISLADLDLKAMHLPNLRRALSRDAPQQEIA